MNKVSCSQNIIIEFLIIDIKHVYPGNFFSCFLELPRVFLSFSGVFPRVYHLSPSPNLESTHNMVQSISVGFIFGELNICECHS